MKIFFFALLILALGVAGAHFQFISSFFGLEVSLLGAALLALNGLRLLFLYFKHGGRDFGFFPSLALLFGLIGLGGGGYVAVQMEKAPLYDISTDTKNPPKFLVPRFKVHIRAGEENLPDVQNFNLDFPSQSQELQKKLYPDVTPLVESAPPFHIVDAVFNAIKFNFVDWKILKEDRANYHLEAEAQEEIFKLIDDVVIEIRSRGANAEESVIQIRSRSRYGRSDFGLNANRIMAVSDIIHEALAKVVGEWKKKSKEDRLAILNSGAKETVTPVATNPAAQPAVATSPQVKENQSEVKK